MICGYHMQKKWGVIFIFKAKYGGCKTPHLFLTSLTLHISATEHAIKDSFGTEVPYGYINLSKKKV